MYVIKVFLLLQIINYVQCAKILAVFPCPGYSQFILGEKLMTELARRGHEVTVISPYKPREEYKNYKSIIIDGIIENTAQMGDLYDLEDESVFKNIILLHEYAQLVSENALANEKVQQLIHSNETFDLVIVEQFLNEAHLGLAPHFKAPLISFCSLGLSEFNSHLVGNLRPPSVNPLTFSSYTDKMTFFQRLHNAVLNSFDTVMKELVGFPFQQKLLDKYFPKPMKLKEIMYNASILLLNSHVSTTHPTTLTTSVVEIGGFHISPKKLPNAIKKYLNEATEGAVFFSMGSNLKSADLSKEKLDGILKMFSKLKQRVLWKFEAEDIPNKPKNVFISKWLPQSDILAHPNLVAFITHGGLLSTTEATHYGVPMVAIPIFGDQKMNVARSVEKGIAVHLPFKKLSEKSLFGALNEVLQNAMYTRNAKKYSNILKDQIAKPIDVAMFWIEYVIRHGGAPHLRNAHIELYWFQTYLLDVVCFVIFSPVVFHYVIKMLIKLIFKCRSKCRTEKRLKKKVN